MSIDFSSSVLAWRVPKALVPAQPRRKLSDTPEFREYSHREFPEQASEWNDPKGRVISRS